MQIIPPEGMGYDRGVAIFSPDGRLFQVQYAMEAVKRGATVIGVVYNSGVILLADKKVFHGLVVPESIEKIYRIDEHIGAATIGLVADGRKLIEDARVEAQRHKLIYGERISLKKLVNELSKIMQIFTQFGGLRPFGVTLLIAGFEDRPRLFEIDPSGTPTEWKATAVGEGRQEVMKFLQERYKPDMSFEEAAKLAVEALRGFLKEKFNLERVEMAKVDAKGFKKLSKEEIKEMMQDGNP